MALAEALVKNECQMYFKGVCLPCVCEGESQEWEKYRTKHSTPLFIGERHLHKNMEDSGVNDSSDSGVNDSNDSMVTRK